MLESDGRLPFQRRSKATGVVRRPVKLKVLGPAGTWTLASARGAQITPSKGNVGDVVTVTPKAGAGAVVDYEITLTYVGRRSRLAARAS